MGASKGAGLNALLQTAFPFVETNPITPAEKTTTSYEELGSNPFYTFGVQEVTVTPPEGYMNLDGQGTAYSISAIVKNYGGKKVENLKVYFLPDAEDLVCFDGDPYEDDNKNYQCDSTPCKYFLPCLDDNTEPCNIQYINKEYKIGSIGDCVQTLSLEPSEQKTVNCFVKTGCIDADVSTEDGVVAFGCQWNDESDYQTAGLDQEVYVYGMHVYVIGPYVSTTRLSIESITPELASLLQKQGTFAQTDRPAINTWGSITLSLDVGKQPIIYTPDSSIIIRVKATNDAKSVAAKLSGATGAVLSESGDISNNLMDKIGGSPEKYEMQLMYENYTSEWEDTRPKLLLLLDKKVMSSCENVGGGNYITECEELSEFLKKQRDWPKPWLDVISEYKRLNQTYPNRFIVCELEDAKLDKEYDCVTKIDTMNQDRATAIVRADYLYIWAAEGTSSITSYNPYHNE